MTKDLETEIFDLIGRLIQTFSSPEIAIDDRHTPKLYARFLAGLLARSRKDGATVGRLHPQLPRKARLLTLRPAATLPICQHQQILHSPSLLQKEIGEADTRAVSRTLHSIRQSKRLTHQYTAQKPPTPSVLRLSSEVLATWDR